MKKFLGVILVLVCFITPAFAEPVSQEVLDQAKTQAGLFMDLKNALGLDWLDKYNAYLANPASSPKPTWTTSVTALINKNYLSSSFPTDFQITPTGQEVTIKRTITNQGIKNALPIYLPSVAISGNTVSLLVQRPAQWVAWEAGLNSKISRDGEDNPDVLPGTSLEFGAGSKIEFVSNDGKLVGINSLTYKGQELEDRFVNVAGDNMTGPLKINNNIVWHAGNDGSGSGLDADLLDGQQGSFYRDAGNLNAGIVPVARLSGTYNINISGRASVATNADYAANSDKLDGKDASDFALSGHGHNYVSKAGDTMTGTLTAPGYNINDANTKIVEGGNNSVRIQTNNGYVDIGPQNTVWAHFNTDRPEFYFNKPVEAEGMLKVYNTGTYLTGVEGKIAGNKIWHAGNDGSGSGLDADLLDGMDSKDFVPFVDLVKSKFPVVDLNDFTKTGFYFGPGPAQGVVLRHAPPEVIDAYSLVVEGAGWDVFQTMTTIALGQSPLNNRVWKRTKIGYAGVWSPWREVVSKPTNYLRLAVFRGFAGNAPSPSNHTWVKGSGTTHVKVYVYGSEDFANQPNGVSKFGNYLSSSNKENPAFGTINVTNVSSVPVVVGAGYLSDDGGYTTGGIVIVEEYSGPPGP